MEVNLAFTVGAMRFALSGRYEDYMAGRDIAYTKAGDDPEVDEALRQFHQDILEWGNPNAPEWQAALELALWGPFPVKWEEGTPEMAEWVRRWPAMRAMRDAMNP